MPGAHDRAGRVLDRCDAVAACTEEPGRITRPFPSNAMMRAQERLRGWMRDAGLQVRTDAIGNVIGRRPAATGDASVLLMGSHLDSVRDAGRYDGVLGVLAALSVAEAVAEPLPFHLDVVAFCDEEGTRFGTTFFGSLALVGAFPESYLDLTDADGVRLREALARHGYRPDEIPSAAYDPQKTIGYLELHTEQGPVLEGLGAPLGLATAIAGQTKGAMRFEGRAAHAGTIPIDGRRDALAGAAEWTLAVEAQARRVPGLFATVGRIQAEPGAVNVVAGAATCSLDVRHAEDATRGAAVTSLLGSAREIARRRGLTAAWTAHVEEPARPLDAGLLDILRRRTDAPTLVSGAGHDAAVLSAFTPTALLFVRCPGGVSHHPDEAVRAADLTLALQAMDGFVRDLAVRTPMPGRESDGPDA